MRKQYFNKWEFDKAVSLFQKNPIECKNRYEEYIEKYPEDYYTYTYYVSVLVEIGEFDKAEKVLNHVIKLYKKDPNFLKHPNKLKPLEQNIFYCKLKLLSYNEKYTELYHFCSDNYKTIRDLEINNLYFYAKGKNNMLDLNSRDENSYIFRQIIEYKQSDFEEHIKKHLASFVSNYNEPNKNLFMPDFPIEKIINEIKKYIPSSKCLFPGLFENVYYFKYTGCGKDNNKIVDYFKVICFHNTQNFITILPCANCENLPHVDLDYLVNTDNLPKIKTLSQIEKFNKRFNCK